MTSEQIPEHLSLAGKRYSTPYGDYDAEWVSANEYTRDLGLWERHEYQFRCAGRPERVLVLNALLQYLTNPPDIERIRDWIENVWIMNLEEKHPLYRRVEIGYDGTDIQMLLG